VHDGECCVSIFELLPVKTFRPLTPSTRYMTYADFSDITKSRPEKSLVYTRKKSGGRNSYGRVTARAIGGGHKQKVRVVDFRRSKVGIEAKVVAVEYDPIRSARLALVEYADGDRRYIICPEGLKVGTAIMNGPTATPTVGNCLPLSAIPMGVTVHNIELVPGKGGQMVRSAGSGATLMSRDSGYAQLRLPSGEIRRVHENCVATIGQVPTRSMRTSSLARLAAAFTEAVVRCPVVWSAIQWTIPMVAVRVSPRVVAVASTWYLRGVSLQRDIAPERSGRFPTGSSWFAGTADR